jgi:hypothetical protein
MKISDILTEVFNSDVQGKVVKQSADSFITAATIGTRDIKFHAAGQQGNWEIDFTEHSSNRGTTYGKSGSGGELQVFSFVIESLKLFISLYNPIQVSFTSDKSDTNRSNLYRRMANKVKITGYHIDMGDGITSGYDTFTIIRDK